MFKGNRYKIGNAQTIGRREVESNYFSTVFNDANDLFLVLADGSIDHLNGRRAAVLSVEYCVNAFLHDIKNVSTNALMLKTALSANRFVQASVYIGKNPRLSLTMVLFVNNEVQFFNVGTNKIFLYNGHSEQSITDDLGVSYSAGKCKLSHKSAIGVMSAGAYAVTHPIERLNIVTSKKDVFNKAQTIIETVKRKCLDNQMNATALLVEVNK